MSAPAAGSPPRPNLHGRDAPANPTPTDEADDAVSSSITVTDEGSTVVIVVRQMLDEREGAALLSAATAAVDAGSERLDIDLRGLEGFTDEGARALVACRQLGSRLAEGLHYRTGRGPGREALLVAYQDAGARPDG